jgi:hypothetical protein
VLNILKKEQKSQQKQQKPQKQFGYRSLIDNSPEGQQQYKSHYKLLGNNYSEAHKQDEFDENEYKNVIFYPSSSKE